LTGNVSTSLDFNQAFRFCHPEEGDTEKVRAVFKITGLSQDNYHFSLNNEMFSEFFEEKEVLLPDGNQYKIESIIKKTIENSEYFEISLNYVENQRQKFQKVNCD
jgi:hypothetical protein